MQGGDAGNAQEENPNNNGNGHRAAGMKALKLPSFNDEKDDLLTYLTYFDIFDLMHI